ncbi:MAG: hypothetical protein H0Z19_04955 [Archaeoglobus sp.]|uniref:hypothetical protein n=1 Tax=Archaeoglobus sp. TaxID=1872626 RepID=UPI001DE4486E|nr:hypothetical protein [Archaeoglobus sp.]MBO8179816.1 hypothetical protein [Archaeoglobus sp.]
MVTEAEFTTALAKFAETSATASAAADRVIAVANVDPGRISEGFNVLLNWGMKIAALLFEEISRNPSLNAKMVASQQMLFANIDVIASVLIKFGPYINKILGNFGLSLVKIIGLFLGF